MKIPTALFIDILYMNIDLGIRSVFVRQFIATRKYFTTLYTVLLIDIFNANFTRIADTINTHCV